ncbi:MAG: hypothetical protein MUP70_17945 [Candidatus Aminicenantes bacterium]|nr:hypothetical protein [Candidatus Aminicenantes bacterium]
MRNRAKSGLLGALLFIFLIPHVWSNGGENREEESIFLNPETLVRGLYEAVTFDIGEEPDWDYVKTMFLPGAVIGVRKTRTTMAVMNVEEFVQWFKDDVEKFKMKERGFEETVQKMKITVYRNMGHAFVLYQARLKTPADAPGQLGVDGFGLLNKDGRWWIASITNDIVDPAKPLPDELR